MIKVGAFDAKTHLSSLLDKVSRGAEVLITRRGRPIARLIPAGRAESGAAAQVSACLGLLDRLPIVTDAETESRALREILALARSENLTTYDASYLELALRRGMKLATLDKPLIRAAARCGINTLPPNAP